MAINISVSNATYDLLEKRIGEEDTANSVIFRLLQTPSSNPNPSAPHNVKERDLAETADQPQTLEKTGDEETLSFEGTKVPSLLHTRLIDATLDGDDIPKKPNYTYLTWNGLRDHLIRRVIKSCDNADLLINLEIQGVISGDRRDAGYKPTKIQNKPYSIQGQGSQICWADSVTISKKMGWQIRAEFQWLDKPNAARPGKNAILNSGS